MKQAEKAELTQQQILDAAIEVFADKGYHDTRVSDIVRSSGTSKGAVYFHFPSKEQIFLSIVDRFASLLADGLVKAIEAEEHGIDRVDAALRTCLDIFSRHRLLAKIFLTQASELGETFEKKKQEINQRFTSVIKGYLDEAIEDGDLLAIDTEVAAIAWMGALYEVIINWVRTGSPSPERTLPTLRLVLLRSVGVSEARIRKLDSRGEK